MTKVKAMAGLVFGRLTVVSQAPYITYGKYNYVAWNCICSCGVSITVIGISLRSGNTKSCGCLQRERIIEATTKHGQTKINNKNPVYKVWAQAKQRCSNPKVKGYSDYGGRGITMCDEWLNDAGAFIAYMGERPPGTSLDRINNDGNYEPGNVRWATKAQQNANKRPYKWRRNR